MKITKVTDKLYRGPRPKSIPHLSELLGVETKDLFIINLQSGFFNEIYNDQYEFDIPLIHGTTVAAIPCSDFRAPSYRKVSNFITTVRLANSFGKLVYVHCKHGVDRTGFMVAAYRIINQRWTAEAAKKEMFDMGFHKFPYYFWHRKLDELGKYYGGGK